MRKVILPCSSKMSNNNGLLSLAQPFKQKLINAKIPDEVDEGDSTNTSTRGDDIRYIETSKEWSQWRDELVHQMFSEWEMRNQQCPYGYLTIMGIFFIHFEFLVFNKMSTIIMQLMYVHVLMITR